MLTPWKESYDQPRQHIKNQRHYFAIKALSSEGYGFSSSHVWIWELDFKENWALKNQCFWAVVLAMTFESPLDCKEIQPVHPRWVLSVYWKYWCWSWKLQYSGHLMRRTDSFVKTLMLGKTECRRRSGQERMRWLDGITKSMDMSLGKHQEFMMDRGPGVLVCGIAKSWTRLSDWTELKWNRQKNCTWILIRH